MSSVGQWLGAAVAVLAILGTLVRISWQMGRLVQQLADHLAESGRVHKDQERRLRTLEQVRRRRWR